MPLDRPQHTCHAQGCNKVVPPKMFMCLTHWRMIPRAMQRELWAAYVPGQEVRKDPTAEYLLVARRLINYVARKEHPNCTNCANPNHCCMEHRIHVDRGKPHVSCILR